MRNKTYRLVLTALFSVVIALTRYIIPIPSFKPTSGLILLAGIGFGPIFGLATGLLSTIISGFFTGFGTWTIFQCIAWGFIGLLGGLLGKKNLISLRLLLPLGVILGFLFGWFMNIEFVLLYMEQPSLSAYIASCVMSFQFDLLHAISNVATLAVLTIPLLNVFKRVK